MLPNNQRYTVTQAIKRLAGKMKNDRFTVYQNDIEAIKAIAEAFNNITNYTRQNDNLTYKLLLHCFLIELRHWKSWDFAVKNLQMTLKYSIESHEDLLHGEINNIRGIGLMDKYGIDPHTKEGKERLNNLSESEMSEIIDKLVIPKEKTNEYLYNLANNLYLEFKNKP